MRLAKLNTILVAALGFFASSSAAFAEYRGQWPSERFHPAQERNVAGVFDYYALVLSWSPTHCQTESAFNDNMQCNRGDGRRYSFVLHGLWPQYEKGFPEACRTQRRPYVPQEMIDGMLDIMPASGLIIHEYKQHGTCSGLDPNQYFGTARRLFHTIRVPERYKNPFESQFVSPGELISEFARANPQLKPDSIAVACGGAGNRLKEIHFCFGKDGQSRACGSNEEQSHLCRADRMHVPPVRSNAREDNGRPQGQQPANRQAPVPHPKLIEGPNGRDD
jgi:ribonuclease T2